MSLCLHANFKFLALQVMSIPFKSHTTFMEKWFFLFLYLESPSKVNWHHLYFNTVISVDLTLVLNRKGGRINECERQHTLSSGKSEDEWRTIEPYIYILLSKWVNTTSTKRIRTDVSGALISPDFKLLKEYISAKLLLQCMKRSMCFKNTSHCLIYLS